MINENMSSDKTLRMLILIEELCNQEPKYTILSTTELSTGVHTSSVSSLNNTSFK